MLRVVFDIQEFLSTSQFTSQSALSIFKVRKITTQQAITDKKQLFKA